MSKIDHPLYPVAERFKSIQGEGMYCGTPMAFVRLVGCSVGKTICNHCDTDFDRSYSWKGGGSHTAENIVEWAEPYTHLCVTGGEPLNHDLTDLITLCRAGDLQVHIETSGTVPIEGFDHSTFITVSPKPGWLASSIELANEIKVIVGGLGVPTASLTWPTLEDALRWADGGKMVFLQPRNDKNGINKEALAHAVELVQQHPTLNLSVQLHKFLGAR